MTIAIHQRFRPFSHLPGTKLIIPYSTYAMTIFPNRWIVEDGMTHREIGRVDWRFKGLVEQFTVQQDLERGRVCIWGKTEEGWFRTGVWVEGDSLVLFLDQGDDAWLEKKVGPWQFLSRMQGDVLPIVPRPCHSRLALGKAKVLDWERVIKACDCAEIFPVWHWLGQMVPDTSLPRCGNGRFFHEYLVDEKKKDLKIWRQWFSTGLYSLLCPTLVDRFHQGVIAEEPCQGSPLGLLTEGSKAIESLFFLWEKEVVSFLPLLPKSFLSGRFLHKEGLFFEWRKGKMRRLTFSPPFEGELHFCFPKGIQSCRLRRSVKDRGSTLSLPCTLAFQEGEFYDLDHFQ